MASLNRAALTARRTEIGSAEVTACIRPWGRTGESCTLCGTPAQISVCLDQWDPDAEDSDWAHRFEDFVCRTCVEASEPGFCELLDRVGKEAAEGDDRRFSDGVRGLGWLSGPLLRALGYDEATVSEAAFEDTAIAFLKSAAGSFQSVREKYPDEIPQTVRFVAEQPKLG